VRRLFQALLLETHFLQPVRRAPAVVTMATLDEELGMLLVQRQALHLVIRRVRAALVGPLIPIDPQPAQTVQDLLFTGVAIARAIRVFDAQQVVAATVAGEN
jgi:hypothetical protein